MGIYLALLIFVPIQSLILIRSNNNGTVEIERLLLAGSGMIGTFFFMQIFYLLMFGLFTSTGLFSPDSYKWLSTLPVEKRSLSKIGLFTLFRSINIQTFVMMLLFPIAILVISQSFFIFLAALVVSFLNTIFALTILIIFGTKFTRIINSNVGNNRGSTLIRISVIIGYLVGTMIASLGIQLVTPLMQNILANQYLSLGSIENLNKILALVAFPLSGGYFMNILFLGVNSFSGMNIILSIVGLILFGFLDYVLVKKALKSFYLAIQPDEGTKSSSGKATTIEDIQISTNTPMKAFFKKDAQNVTRDVQSLMFVVLPIILPSLVMLITAIPVLAGDEYVDLSAIYWLTIIYMFLGAFMLTFGVVDIENTGASVLASLPIVIREQAKAKILWAFFIIPLANLIPGLFYIGKPFFWDVFFTFILSIPLGIIFSAFILELKVFLFGKMKYKYVLDEVKIEHKVLKIILMSIIGLVICILSIILIVTLTGKYEWIVAYSIIILIEVGLGTIVYWIFNRMFPKPKIA